MTNKWEKVLNELTVIAILIILLHGSGNCFDSWCSLTTAMSDGESFVAAQAYRHIVSAGITTLLLIALCFLISRLFYLYLKRQIPLWEAEDTRQSEKSDEMTVFVRVVHDPDNLENGHEE